MGEPLLAYMVRCTEEQDLIDLPYASGARGHVPGPRSYTVTLSAKCDTLEEFEAWRAVMGQVLEVRPRG